MKGGSRVHRVEGGQQAGPGGWPEAGWKLPTGHHQAAGHTAQVPQPAAPRSHGGPGVAAQGQAAGSPALTGLHWHGPGRHSNSSELRVGVGLVRPWTRDPESALPWSPSKAWGGAGSQWGVKRGGGSAGSCRAGRQLEHSGWTKGRQLVPRGWLQGKHRATQRGAARYN